MITVSSRVTSLDTISGFLGAECGSGHINPKLSTQLLTEKWDLPRLYFTAHTKSSGIAGFAVVTFMKDVDGACKAYLELVCSRHRQGSRLMRAIKHVSSGMGVDFVQLSAATSSLVKYYGKFGFRRAPNPCLTRQQAMNLRRRVQYTRSTTPAAGWKGFIDGGRTASPVMHHKNGNSDGFLMSVCVRNMGVTSLGKLVRSKQGRMKFSKPIALILNSGSHGAQ